MSLAQERAIVKENKTLKKQLEKAQLKEAFLRAEILERATEFVNQTEIIFALVDHIFKSEDIRTLGEANRKWDLFKKTVNESENAQTALDVLGIEIHISTNENQQMIMDMWSQDRKNRLKQA